MGQTQSNVHNDSVFDQCPQPNSITTQEDQSLKDMGQLSQQDSVITQMEQSSKANDNPKPKVCYIPMQLPLRIHADF